MASLHCPNPECPFLKRFRVPAEYREGSSTCGECGSALVAASVPAPAVAVAEQAPDLAVRRPRPEGASRDLARRVAISLAALIAAALSQRVMLTGLQPSLSSASVFDLAIHPLLTASVLVELAALLIPPWRRLRTGGPRERARLRTAALGLGLLFTLRLAFVMARMFADFTYEGAWWFSDSYELTVYLIALVLAGGVVALQLLTVLVDRAGLGNGYAVVLLGFAVPPAAGSVSRLWSAAQYGRMSIAELALGALGGAGMVWGMARLLRGRVQGSGDGAERPRWLPLPVSGIAPLSFAGVVLALPDSMADFLFSPWVLFLDATKRWDDALLPGLRYVVLLSLLTAVFSVLFHQPRRVGAVWAGLSAKDPAERSVVRDRTALRARELLPTAAAWSLALMMLAWLPLHLTRHLWRSPLYSALALLLAVAVVMDLLDEARMRRAGTWTRVWPVHRVYEVEPALAALTAAGIPAWAQGVHTRALFQFFGPFFPIELMVPPDRAQEALALLEKSREP